MGKEGLGVGVKSKLSSPYANLQRVYGFPSCLSSSTTYTSVPFGDTATSWGLWNPEPSPLNVDTNWPSLISSIYPFVVLPDNIFSGPPIA